MEVIDLPLPGLKLIRPRVFRDERGHFLELMHGPRYARAGLPPVFVQDNVSCSRKGVLRGLHYQHPRWQGKLISVLQGEIFDVAVDLRRESATFGKWHGQTLNDEDHAQIWVPAGFAHGFCAVSETATVHYKCTELYDPASEHTILATDPALGIRWPVDTPIVSPKDAAGVSFEDAVLP